MTRYSQAVHLGDGTSQEHLQGIPPNVFDCQGDSLACLAVATGEAHDDLGMGIRFAKGVIMGILLSCPIWALILWALL
jgi:hypothetical protein